MALNTKTIKRRIKSIGNTKKITKAMEMISAVKMRKAIGNVLSTRNYSHLAWEMLYDVAKKTDITLHPLLEIRPIKRVGVILIASNRGLAGGFNSKILQETHKYIVKESSNENVETEVIISGKQAKKIYHRFGHTVAAEFTKYDLTTKIDEILPITQTIINDYISGRYDKIVVAFTDYISAVSQTPLIKQVLPITTQTSLELNSKNVLSTQKTTSELKNDPEYLFEPNPRKVLDILLPRLVEIQIYQAILESDASEHSARMMAMKSASDSAGEMIKELNYSFNKARQASITREISEIVGGAAALE